MNKIRQFTSTRSFNLLNQLTIFVLCLVLNACSFGPTRPTLTSSTQSGTYGGTDRGSYRGSYYTVQKGDTLHFISYLTNQNVNDLIAYNDLQPPYMIKPGQKIKLWGTKYVPPVYGYNGRTVDKESTAPPVNTDYNQKRIRVEENKKNFQKTTTKKVVQSENKGYIEINKKETNSKQLRKESETTYANTSFGKVDSWLWPTKGRIIAKFSRGEQGNNGIDIAGQRGQDIIATASGQIVYAGNALRGYGNLIIIKHNDDYLSAYAHNESLFVKEGQTVKAGQKIASMGSSGTSSVRLHFEIRLRGKSVNPQRYLP